MATEQRTLKQDGYLDVGDDNDVPGGFPPFEMRNILYHPHLNVLLAFGVNNLVKVLDVNSGVILQTYQLSTNAGTFINGRYMPLQDKILFWDGHNLGLRGDYNGVLLLDTILQAPIGQNDEYIKLELVLLDAIIFQNCIHDLESEGLECPADISNELTQKINQAQLNSKKGFKAQRWNTICLEVPYSSLKLVANNVVILLKRLERHIPVLAIASAINERLTDMLQGSRVPDFALNFNNFQRVLMHSEAIRRQTFEKWPHMDYKWALPDQMAQAGFYHQPSATGEDRAMCFTCNVCLVCWEKTDEPWSEHERHSPLCPFVRGEYTQNVPLSITYATNPAQTSPGLGFDIISNSDYANVLCTSCTETGELSVWSIERHLKLMHTVHVPTLLKDVFEESFEWARVTAICVLPNARARTRVNYVYSANYGAGGAAHSGGMRSSDKFGGVNSQHITSTSTLRAGVVGSKIVLGISVRQSSGELALRMVVLNIIEVDRYSDSSVSMSNDSGSICSSHQFKKTSSHLGPNITEANVIISSHDSKDDDNKSFTPYEKFADGFDSNGFVSALMTSYKSHATAHGPDNTSALYDFDLSTLSHMLEPSLDDPTGSIMLTSNTVNVGNNLLGMDNDMEKLIEEASVVQQNNNNNNNNDSPSLGGSSSNNNNNCNGSDKAIRPPCEEIDCVVESWTSVKRMNSLSSTDGGAAESANGPLPDVQEIVEIAEIIPTSPKCNQLLVKLQRTKAPETEASKIIMATVEKEDEVDVDEHMETNDNNAECNVAAQLLLFDYDDTQISNDYTLAVTFSRAKSPKQLCILPPFNHAEQKETGAICVVCSDGSVEIYSLADFQPTHIIEEEGEHFEAVVYCRNLERLCCCSRQGVMLFFSLSEGDNDSGDEMLEIEDDCSTALIQANASIDVTVTDAARDGAGAEPVNPAKGEITTNMNDVITIDVSNTPATDSGSIAASSSSQVQTSPSTMSILANNSNLLANKTSELTLEDLRIFYALIQFDEKLTVYSAEVPSCWNDLGQVQKQRKQSQNLRHGGDDREFTHTWRLHNDATTWDEHIIEINLAQPVSLGHVDLKFTVYQQCSNPAAIQVTLLKQNTNGFGYRMKGAHNNYKPNVVDDNIDLTYVANENPVLSEEYLQAHNAEVLSGPIELSSCIDLCDQGGTATLTSPKLFKTRSRNFLLHIKTVADPSKDGQNKTRVALPVPHHKGSHQVEDYINENAQYCAQQLQITKISVQKSINKSCATHINVLEQIKKQILKQPSQKFKSALITIPMSHLPPCGWQQHQSSAQQQNVQQSSIHQSFSQHPHMQQPCLYQHNLHQHHVYQSVLLPFSVSQPWQAPDFKLPGTVARGCDWLHEISISVRGVKTQSRVSNARIQRIAMLDSNGLLEQLFRLASSADSSPLSRNLALDVLNWICFIRLNRFRSPKSERIKEQINKQTAANINDLLAQQFECICLAEKHIESMLRNCIIYSERTTAHKCVKLIVTLTEGAANLPIELQKHSTLDNTIKTAISNTFNEISQADCGSVVRWYTMLTCATSTAESHNSISEMAINLLKDIANEIDKRWDPYCALLSTRFGLYGFPFEPEIFDFDFPNTNRNGSSASPMGVSSVIRSSASILPVTTLDIKRLSSIDGVDFRTFPHLIRGKSISNQMRGLLEVVQLHFTCVQTSEATRVDNIDTASGTGASSVVMEDVMMMPKLVVAKEKDEELLNDLVNDVQCLVEEMKDKDGKTAFDTFGMVNGFKDKTSGTSLTELEHALKEEVKNEKAKFDNLKISKFLPQLTLWNTYIQKKFGMKEDIDYIDLTDVDNWAEPHCGLLPTKMFNENELPPQLKNIYLQQDSQKVPQPAGVGNDAGAGEQYPVQSATSSTTVSDNIPETVEDDDAESEKIIQSLNANPSQPIAWHKIITPPPKQMAVIDRMHSGARRFVVLDFGQPTMLTDLIIPACDELTSLTIDIWCFDEDTDSMRLVQVADIQTKTLVLSDMQPPPICRYLKMTIIGRIGMSSTKCKVPLGTFFGHPVILEHDGYGDNLARYTKQPLQTLHAHIKSLNSLYEDVHCRYSLASCKLMELMAPMRNSELSNVAHLQAFINKQRDEELSGIENNNKVVTLYEECMLLQYQINVIRNVVSRLERAVSPSLRSIVPPKSLLATDESLRHASRDKLRVLSLSLVEVLLHFSIEYGIKNILPGHQRFNVATAKMLFDSLVVYGDAQLQLATCSLLVRMCCFQSWWGEFLADTFCSLFSAQNCKAFPQDRIFFLLTYLGRRSIAMGTCRSIVIDAVLKTLARLLAPISPHYNIMPEEPTTSARAAEFNTTMGNSSDLQLITWLLLFLSVCLDDHNNDRKDKSATRWDFMSCESDFTKTRHSNSSKQLRCFKKRIIQQNKYSIQPYTDWGKKIYMIQNEHPGIFMELSGKSKSCGISKGTSSINTAAGNNTANKITVVSGSSFGSNASTSSSSTNTSSSTQGKSVSTISPKQQDFDVAGDGDSNFDKGLKALRMENIKVVIRGLFTLLLEMDFDCNMDQFLLTCKVIARLVAACRPSVQLSKIVTTAQLEQLVRLAVWNDQQQPWAVHAITCLLQDLLDADKQYRDNDATPTNDSTRSMETAVQETRDIFTDFSSVKYNYLPSLIECDDTEFDEMLNDIDMIERTKPITKKESNALCKSTFNFFCKSISIAMDSRLEVGLDLHVETQLRRLTNRTSLDLYSSLPQVITNEFITTPTDAAPWPEFLTQLWSGPEYNSGNTYLMFKNVFDTILADLHYEDTWVHMEQVLHMWLTLNCELSEKPYTSGITQTDVPKIPFGANAVQGLLLALAWHNDIKLRTWCLGFECLFLACNSLPIGDDVTDCIRIHEVIVNDENFEKMLMRFFSGYGMTSFITNRCAGPTICKHLHELLLLLHSKSESSGGLIASKRRLKDILLHVVLQLVQPGGAISNQQGPIDGQNQLVRDLLLMPNDKGDLNIALKIIESVSFLVYNNISNGEKLQCQRTNDNTNAGNNFSNLFANVLGSENPNKQSSIIISDNSLIINLLKLSSHLVLTEMPRQPSEVTIPEEEELSNQSQTDETKAEQLNTEGHRSKVPCIADWVLRQFPTMKRLFGSLSQCSTNAFTMMTSNCFFSMKSQLVWDEPVTFADAVFSLMITLSEKASNPRLVVAPICQYLEETTVQRNASLPRLQLSEPFLWYISKVLEVTAAVQIFTQLGGIQIICYNLVRLNKTIINMQPGLISLIMQHMTLNTRLKLNNQVTTSTACKKTGTTTTTAPTTSQPQPPRTSAQYDGLINFAPFSHIASENDAAQNAEVLISNPSATHRRPRSPAWSYMFYPNEMHVDLTITLPTAILLKEVQLMPHTSSLASCPSAVALELSRDYGLGSIPVGPPMATTGLTCIRLKLAKAEVVTSIVLRLYKPKDCGNVGLVQIAVLGQTIFGNRSHALRSQGGYSGTGVNCGSTLPVAALAAMDADILPEDDAFAKTSIGWVRILSRCFNVAALQADQKLSDLIASYPAAYPGFLEACCSLLNIMPMIPSLAQQHLETILFKMGSYNQELCLQLLRTLLWQTTPQVFKLSSDAICDLIHELVTNTPGDIEEKIHVLLTWVTRLHDNYSEQSRCNNPQSGFVKVIASILWHVQEQQLMPELPELICPGVFECCFNWINTLEHDEPLKASFDSFMCSLCYICPELFNELLSRLGVNLQLKARGLTDDNKVQNGSAWFKREGAANLQQLLEYPSFLKTLALACQSPSTVYQMLDSGLPKLLAHAVYEYCNFLLPLAETVSGGGASNSQNSAAASVSPAPSGRTTDCLTDCDKADRAASAGGSNMPLLTSTNVPKVLDFFSDCCAEGPMRDWLGTMQGSIFWKPLLQLLCNTHSSDFSKTLPMQQTFIRLERATINFFTRVSACHPTNQEALTSLLIGVIICKPLRPNQGSGNLHLQHVRPTISGFTRQLVLQLLLENEHIMVSVRSKQPLHRRDTLSIFMNATSSTSAHGNSTGSAGASSVNNNSLPLAASNHHPAKRCSAHHVLFNVTTSTTCQEILQNCVSDQTNTSSSLVNAAAAAVAAHKAHDSKQEKSTANSINDLHSMDASSMEFLTVGAAVAAKDKRIKDVKNQAAVNKDKGTQTLGEHIARLFNVEEFLQQTSNIITGSQLVIPDHPDIVLAGDATISQVLSTLQDAGQSLSTPCITLDLVPVQRCTGGEATSDVKKTKASCTEPLPSPLQRFSNSGGLSLLAHYLPTVYPDSSGRKTQTVVPDKEKSPLLSDWVKLEPNDEIYEDLEDPVCEPTIKQQATVSSVPPHSLAAFGLFLRLPAYSDVLLRDKLRAQCLLRLVLGVTGDGEGNDIYSLPLAPSLPTLPFEVFRQLLDSVPLTTDDGVLLRRVVIEVGAMHLVLNCLGIFSHQSHNNKIGVIQPETPASGSNGGGNGGASKSTEEPPTGPTPSDDKSHMYWAKGTGFGTGSTTQSWNVEQALLRQKSEEEHVTVLLQVLSSYINPGDCIPSELHGEDILAYHEVRDVTHDLPPLFQSLLQQSCLVPALSSYLRNDSVLDITRHIPLYRAILKLLRALSLSKQMVSLLQPLQSSSENAPPIVELLKNMKMCVDTYARRLKVNKKSNIKGQTQQQTFNIDDGDDEGLALLIPDIHETTVLVEKTTEADALINMLEMDEDGQNQLDRKPLSKSIEQRYLEAMKKLQFDTYDMVVEAENNGFRFVVSHHFEKMVRLSGDRYHPSRVKRLAQEAVTLSTSLPLSFSSSVFVRCDTDRLDIMKVLITGPADTPYANGCFEFDVYFPPDYPNLPMLINLETTGRHSVRFNPNLYNDGKVCLSVLNTWHGRPEEKWNAQTSSFLQVLVSIQSLILVPEPYFNEPGFERSRGTPSGTNSSREYNSNIYQACVRWAMLEQIRNPSPCFKDIIQKHFWLKREEICTQIEGWIDELGKPQYTERSSRTISFNSMVLRRHYRHLREELAKLKPPQGLEDLEKPFNPVASLPPMDVSATPSSTSATNAQVGTDDSGVVPEMNLASEEHPMLLSPTEFYKDFKTDTPHITIGGVDAVIDDDVIEILSDTENEGTMWPEKDDEIS
ncbi:baculoviral IAP repeat-containing protein 6 isoform X2 [Scaptodrosophila lebanonensis]|uniref:Dual E2 ubiquitin-conjugating enzyme/E3 ubiquitin-protein ligase BIRC6 n=1 Tax=Drosophila lebanonensis TaxID=7225 RepID=A0A6J2T2T5_DROLE|nr:baculoviral IAP repeat-containing protein 6 isoform X2 [Scaptodrosophila lebanonensis]